MEIVVVVLLLLLVIGALVFAWIRFRPTATGGARARGGRTVAAGRRRGRAAARRDDPMAEAVERHSLATDPHEAAEEELRLRAQANRVAADLHAREAASLDAQAAGNGGRRHSVFAQDHGRPAHDAPPAVDEDGRPVYEEGHPLDEDGRPVHRDDPRSH